MKEFQFTPLREGRQERERLVSFFDLFQFTPLREGRRILIRKTFPQLSISIHAPT